MADKTYEMLWDCQFCGSKKNLGKTHRHCPNCGAPQDPKARYFPSDDERLAVEDHHYVGADIVCPACGTASSRTVNNCGGCGSPLAQAKGVQLRQDRVVADGAQVQAESSTDARAEFSAPAAPKAILAPAATAAKKPIVAGCIGFGVLGAVLLMLILGGGMCVFNKCSAKQAGFEVDGHSWKREIAIEKFASVEESGWCDSKPVGAEEISRTKEKRSTKKVPDGEECKNRKVDQGDGTFKEKRECSPKYKEESVLDDKCRYRVKKWTSNRSAIASGTSLDDKPHWPDVNLAREGTCDGCERKGESKQSYTLRLVDVQSRKEYTCDYGTDGKWSSFKVRSKWTGKVGGLSGSLDCDTLVAAP